MTTEPTQFHTPPSLEERLTHPCFIQPKDPNVKVWRYMNLAKLVSLLSGRELHFTRLDRFSDPYEGTFPKKTIEDMERWFKKENKSPYFGGMKAHFAKMRGTYFVSCWYASNHESEAMWRLYRGSSGGVAIQTTYAKLLEAIRSDYTTYAGMVTYIDYETHLLPWGNGFYPTMHKRIAFEHEREVRIVKWWSADSISGKHEPPEHLTLAWDSTDLCEHVFVDPNAPKYYYDSVQAVVGAFAPELTSAIRWSRLKDPPAF
jgi:hypothetical protein